MAKKNILGIAVLFAGAVVFGCLMAYRTNLAPVPPYVVASAAFVVMFSAGAAANKILRN